VAYETIIYDEPGADHVATITLNRPERLNAFNRRMMDEFADVWTRVKDDDAVHAVVLRAAGDRAFCTGVDVREDFGQPANVWNHIDPGDSLSPKRLQVWKPVVCALHGMVAGGALYWVNESDIIICSDDATFFDPHVTFGMVPALEPIGLARRVHLGEVLRMALLGNDERMSAETALRIGLVTEVTSREALWERAHQLAARIAAKPTVATQGAVRAIWESLDKGRTAALDQGLAYTRIGNRIGEAQVDRASAPKADWELR